jgi:hypothetical protein
MLLHPKLAAMCSHAPLIRRGCRQRETQRE